MASDQQTVGHNLITPYTQISTFYNCPKPVFVIPIMYLTIRTVASFTRKSQILFN